MWTQCASHRHLPGRQERRQLNHLGAARCGGSGVGGFVRKIVEGPGQRPAPIIQIREHDMSENSDPARPPEKKLGRCHRYPPDVFYREAPHPSVPHLDSSFPIVHGDNWCGEFRNGAKTCSTPEKCSNCEFFKTHD